MFFLIFNLFIYVNDCECRMISVCVYIYNICKCDRMCIYDSGFWCWRRQLFWFQFQLECPADVEGWSREAWMTSNLLVLEDASFLKLGLFQIGFTQHMYVSHTLQGGECKPLFQTKHMLLWEKLAPCVSCVTIVGLKVWPVPTTSHVIHRMPRRKKWSPTWTF